MVKRKTQSGILSRLRERGTARRVVERAATRTEFAAAPSTMLRMVPLPRAGAQGRIPTAGVPPYSSLGRCTIVTTTLDEGDVDACTAADHGVLCRSASGGSKRLRTPPTPLHEPGRADLCRPRPRGGVRVRRHRG